MASSEHYCERKRTRAYLDEEKGGETGEDWPALVVDGVDADDMDRGAKSDEDHRADGLKEIELVAHLAGELGVEKGDGDDDKLDGHKIAEDLEDNLEHWPFLGLHQTPGAGRKDERVPCSDGERAHEEILVRAEMGRQVEIWWQKCRNIEPAHGCCWSWSVVVESKWWLALFAPSGGNHIDRRE